MFICLRGSLLLSPHRTSHLFGRFFFFFVFLFFSELMEKNLSDSMGVAQTEWQTRFSLFHAYYAYTQDGTIERSSERMRASYSRRRRLPLRFWLPSFSLSLLV